MSVTHASAVPPRAAPPVGSATPHEPAGLASTVRATPPLGLLPDESAGGSASAHERPHTASVAPRRERPEREEVAGLREMVDSLGAQLDLLYAERDDAARELSALRASVASLTEQLVDLYARQEQLDACSTIDGVASGAPASERAPTVGR